MTYYYIVHIDISGNKKTVVKSGGSKTIKKAISSNVIVSKPSAEMKLYAFPSFDKSKSMIYFASTYARLLNSGELDELGRVIKAYCAKDCPVKLHETLIVSTVQYVDLLSIANIFHPDSMCCMHSTKVIENTIKSVLYFKYTDVPEMYTYADTVVTDPAYKWVYVGKRKNILRRNLQLDKQSEETQRRIYDLLDKNESVQVYGKIVLTLTCDHFTKKIVHVDYDSIYTSIAHQKEHIMLNELN